MLFPAPISPWVPTTPSGSVGTRAYTQTIATAHAYSEGEALGGDNVITRHKLAWLAANRGPAEASQARAQSVFNFTPPAPLCSNLCDRVRMVCGSSGGARRRQWSTRPAGSVTRAVPPDAGLEWWHGGSLERPSGGGGRQAGDDASGTRVLAGWLAFGVLYLDHVVLVGGVRCPSSVRVRAASVEKTRFPSFSRNGIPLRVKKQQKQHLRVLLFFSASPPPLSPTT